MSLLWGIWSLAKKMLTAYRGASRGANHERCKTGIMKKSAMTESKDSEYCGNQSLWDVEIAVRIGN